VLLRAGHFYSALLILSYSTLSDRDRITVRQAARLPPRLRLEPERLLRARPAGFLQTSLSPREVPRELRVLERLDRELPLEREFWLEREFRDEVPRAELFWLDVPRAVVRRDLWPRAEDVLRVARLPPVRERELPLLLAWRLPRDPELLRRDALRRGLTCTSISSISTSSSISSSDADDCELLAWDRFDPREPELRDERPPLRPLSSALSRLTSLLKLLCWPRAVWSCTSSARLRSSNFWNQSSHDISSSDPAPL